MGATGNRARQFTAISAKLSEFGGDDFFRRGRGQGRRAVEAALPAHRFDPGRITGQARQCRVPDDPRRTRVIIVAPGAEEADEKCERTDGDEKPTPAVSGERRLFLRIGMVHRVVCSTLMTPQDENLYSAAGPQPERTLAQSRQRYAEKRRDGREAAVFCSLHRSEVSCYFEP